VSAGAPPSYYFAARRRPILDQVADHWNGSFTKDPSMTDSADGAQDGTIAEDRRSNEVLRALVGEMLERVREVARRTSAWSPAERAQAEAELEAIMAHVRREATTERKGD
jgi:hypothetical protein